jgi:hypothetical protein
LLPKGVARVKELNKAVLTPILLITHPETYVVWNGTLEAAMEELQIWPKFGSTDSIGTRYEVLCDLIRSMAEYLNIDLWTLDVLWWRIVNPVFEPEPKPEETELPVSGKSQAFGLERHLQDFLLDNWESTELGNEWDLVAEGGEVEGYGYERQTEVGRIDLLAHHKSSSRWLVIELKRGQSTDTTVGQISRYMGWVKSKLAGPSDSVEGVIISLTNDETLRYALMVIPNVRFLRYQIDFHLVDSESSIAK